MAATFDGIQIASVPRDFDQSILGKRIGQIAAGNQDSLYPAEFAFFGSPLPGRTVEESVRDYQRELRGMEVRIVPWLQDFSLRRPYGLAEVTDQVSAARRARTGGYMLWNPLGVYTQEALAAR